MEYRLPAPAGDSLPPSRALPSARPGHFIAPEDRAAAMEIARIASTESLQLAPADERRDPGQARMSASPIMRA